MQIPNSDRAIVDLKKLTHYCLDSTNEVGGHKARVFASALGFEKKDAFLLSSALRKAVNENDAVAGRSDEFGERYVVDFVCSNGAKIAQVRSVWIIDTGYDIPRLVTCFVL